MSLLLKGYSINMSQTRSLLERVPVERRRLNQYTTASHTCIDIYNHALIDDFIHECNTFINLDRPSYVCRHLWS